MLNVPPFDKSSDSSSFVPQFLVLISGGGGRPSRVLGFCLGRLGSVLDYRDLPSPSGIVVN